MVLHMFMSLDVEERNNVTHIYNLFIYNVKIIFGVGESFGILQEHSAT